MFAPPALFPLDVSSRSSHVPPPVLGVSTPVSPPRSPWGGWTAASSFVCSSRRPSSWPAEAKASPSLVAVPRPLRASPSSPRPALSLSRASFSSEPPAADPPRRRSPRAASHSRSLFAESLAACDTSDQVLQLLRVSASSPVAPSAQGRSAVSPSAVMLLPEDCLAFLNALIRVQHVKRSGPDFLFFCDALENALARVNAANAREQTHAQETRERQQLERCLQACLRGRDSKTPSGVASREARSDARSLRWTEQRRKHETERGKFVRAVLQKLAELKAPLAFQRMTPFLEPHLPYLSAFDVAECLWAFATLQPPDWRDKNGQLVRRLVERLLEPREEAAWRGDPPTGRNEKGGDSEARSKGKASTAVATRDTADEARESESCGEASSPHYGSMNLALHRDREARLVVTDGETRSDKKQTERKGTQSSVSAGHDRMSADPKRRLETQVETETKEQLLWVQADTRQESLRNEERHAPQGAAGNDGAEGNLLLDNLSNLMVYRVTFGLAKLDFRCRLTQQVFQALAAKKQRVLVYEPWCVALFHGTPLHVRRAAFDSDLFDSPPAGPEAWNTHKSMCEMYCLLVNNCVYMHTFMHMYTAGESCSLLDTERHLTESA
uniref:Uncharacterized protein n=1 Tax=Neospora caninum (strain Liverpool) TaxID=572307 RepID=F0JB22_NEOCL|nr:hypothetical protein, conserved [Neospora caninum Liverpool]CEL71288.1 TPA: hypothetical protein, conserved [Neospora caninum Liverpool]